MIISVLLLFVFFLTCVFGQMHDYVIGMEHVFNHCNNLYPFKYIHLKRHFKLFQLAGCKFHIMNINTNQQHETCMLITKSYNKISWVQFVLITSNRKPRFLSHIWRWLYNQDKVICSHIYEMNTKLVIYFAYCKRACCGYFIIYLFIHF